MKFSILVYGAPTSSQAAASAYRFARAAIEKGHQIHRVFFYGDGVHTATRLSAVPQDETDLYRQWRELAQNHQLDMVVCIAAALKRGVLDDEEAGRFEKDGDNLAEGFELSGLGQLVDATQA